MSTPDQRRIPTHPANSAHSRILHKQRIVHSRLARRVLDVRTFHFAFFDYLFCQPDQATQLFMLPFKSNFTYFKASQRQFQE